MKREIHYAGGLVIDYNNNTLLLAKNLMGNNNSNYQYAVPKVEMSLGENVTSELKRELEGEFELQLRFRKILPETWTRLVFSMKKPHDKFIIYYIYELLAENAAERRRQRPDQNNYAWIDPFDVELADLAEQEQGLIELVRDIM